MIIGDMVCSACFRAGGTLSGQSTGRYSLVAVWQLAMYLGYSQRQRGAEARSMPPTVCFAPNCSGLGYDEVVPTIVSTHARRSESTVNLSSNRITKLQDFAFSGHSFSVLDLSDNLINAIDALAFSGLEKTASIISLDRNNIQSIAQKTFSALSNLMVLNLSRNNIVGVESGIVAFDVGPLIIDLSYNKIETLRGFLRANDSSETSAADGCLKAVGPVATSAPCRGITLILRSNALRSFPACALQNPYQRSRDWAVTIDSIDDNPLFCDCRDASWSNISGPLDFHCAYTTVGQAMPIRQLLLACATSARVPSVLCQPSSIEASTITESEQARLMVRVVNEAAEAQVSLVNIETGSAIQDVHRNTSSPIVYNVTAGTSYYVCARALRADAYAPNECVAYSAPVASLEAYAMRPDMASASRNLLGLLVVPVALVLAATAAVTASNRARRHRNLQLLDRILSSARDKLRSTFGRVPKKTARPAGGAGSATGHQYDSHLHVPLKNSRGHAVTGRHSSEGSVVGHPTAAPADGTRCAPATNHATRQAPAPNEAAQSAATASFSDSSVGRACSPLSSRGSPSGAPADQTGAAMRKHSATSARPAARLSTSSPLDAGTTSRLADPYILSLKDACLLPQTLSSDPAVAGRGELIREYDVSRYNKRQEPPQWLNLAYEPRAVFQEEQQFTGGRDMLHPPYGIAPQKSVSLQLVPPSSGVSDLYRIQARLRSPTYSTASLKNERLQQYLSNGATLANRPPFNDSALRPTALEIVPQRMQGKACNTPQEEPGNYARAKLSMLPQDPRTRNKKFDLADSRQTAVVIPRPPPTVEGSTRQTFAGKQQQQPAQQQQLTRPSQITSKLQKRE